MQDDSSAVDVMDDQNVSCGVSELNEVTAGGDL